MSEVSVTKTGFVKVNSYGTEMTPLEAEKFARKIREAAMEARKKTPPRRKRIGEY